MYNVTYRRAGKTTYATHQAINDLGVTQVDLPDIIETCTTYGLTATLYDDHAEIVGYVNPDGRVFLRVEM